MDRPDNDHLGDTGEPHSGGYGPDKLRYVALPAGRRRGRILSWYYPLLHLRFPSHHHAPIVSGFLIRLPVAVAVGAPISTGLLGLDGLFGLRGWQVMYLAEAIPTVIIGVLTYSCSQIVLSSKIPDPGRTRLARCHHRRRTPRQGGNSQFTLWQALYNPKVLLLALNLSAS